MFCRVWKWLNQQISSFLRKRWLQNSMHWKACSWLKSIDQKMPTKLSLQLFKCMTHLSKPGLSGETTWKVSSLVRSEQFLLFCISLMELCIKDAFFSFWIFITFLRKPAFSEVFPYFEGRSLRIFIICYLFSETSNKVSMHSPATCMLVDIRMRASHANIWQRYCGF